MVVVIPETTGAIVTTVTTVITTGIAAHHVTVTTTEITETTTVVVDTVVVTVVAKTVIGSLTNKAEAVAVAEAVPVSAARASDVRTQLRILDRISRLHLSLLVLHILLPAHRVLLLRTLPDLDGDRCEILSLVIFISWSGEAEQLILRQPCQPSYLEIQTGLQTRGITCKSTNILDDRRVALAAAKGGRRLEPQQQNLFLTEHAYSRNKQSRPNRNFETREAVALAVFRFWQTHVFLLPRCW